MLLRVVGSCCTKLEMVQSLKPTTPNISFVPWLPKHSATMLDPFAHYCQHARNNSQHCWAKTAWLPFWQTYLRIMLYWKFRKIKPLLFKIIIILLIIIIYKSTFPCLICFRYCHHFWCHHISFLMYCMFMSYHLSITFAKWVVLNVTVKFSKQVF